MALVIFGNILYNSLGLLVEGVGNMLNVSVVMATYNGEKYIKEQLASIENQTFLPFEVIVVDDASIDCTADIIEDFAKTSKLNIKLYKNRENTGYLENFKKGLTLAKGDVVALCDQDDIWESEKIETVSDIFENDNVSGVAVGFKFIDENGSDYKSDFLKEGYFAFVEKEPKTRISKISLKQITKRNIAPGCACAFGKQAVDMFLSGCVDGLPHDYQLSAVAAAMDGLYFYNRPLTRYRIHGNNTLGLKPLNQTRLDIAEEKSKLGQVVSSASVEGKEFFDVSRKRYEYLKGKKPFKILKMFLNRGYRKYYTFKERTGDFIYAAKR